MLEINRRLHIPEEEIEYHPIRASGPGGQNVNKVATAIQLRFDIHASSLPEEARQRLLHYRDHRITRDGTIVIKAQNYRSQEQNRADARERLGELLRAALHTDKPRRPSRPSRASQKRRKEAKQQHKQKKAMRRPPKPGS